ncbi:MAG: PEGA domain-containing protein, partial [Calditrichaeota bacterium]
MLILLLAMACSKAQLPLGVEPVSTLEVTAIDPEGRNVDSAKVFLNGKLVGMTPYRNEELKAGLIAIRVEKEGFRLFTSQLVVQQEQTYSIEAVLTPLDPTEGELLITVNQDSALVKVKDANDNVVVETYERTSKHVLPAGAYVVSAEKPGFPMAVQAVNVVVGQTVSVHLELVDNSQPPSLDFQVVEDTVEVGSMVTLTWQSDGVRVIIDQGIGERGPSGTEQMVCTQPGTKVFTATAYSAEDVATERKDSVYVVPKTVIPPTLEFDASPDTLMFGEPVFLQWHTNGFQVAIDQGVGLRGPDGTEEVVFQNPGKKVFTAIAFGEDDT